MAEPVLPYQLYLILAPVVQKRARRSIADPQRIGSLNMRPFLFLLAVALPAQAWAADQVHLANDVFVERVRRTADGAASVVLEPPRRVSPGDRLLFVLSYRNRGSSPAADLVVTNPVPDAVSFVRADDEDADVSVDGGVGWGKLGQLQVRDTDGRARSARPEDVTHVRWRIAAAVPSGQGGELSFRAVAR